MGKSNFYFVCKRMFIIVDNGCLYFYRDSVLFFEGDVGGGSWKILFYRYILGDD